jgi:hypothetical protein
MPICGVYLMWVCLHYVSTHAYAAMCVPISVYGFVMSPFHAPMPHCVGLRYLIYNGGLQINQMWFLLGMWLCVKLHNRNSLPVPTVRPKPVSVPAES